MAPIDRGRDRAIAALASKFSKAADGKPTDIVGAALSTFAARICRHLSRGDMDMAIGGIDALATDAKIHLQMTMKKAGENAN